MSDGFLTGCSSAVRYCSNCSCRLSRHCSPAELYCTAERTVLAGSARFHGQQPALPRAAARPAKPKLLFTTGRCSAVWRAVRGQAAGYSSIDTKSPPGVHLQQYHGGAVLRHSWQAAARSAGYSHLERRSGDPHARRGRTALSSTANHREMDVAKIEIHQE